MFGSEQINTITIEDCSLNLRKVLDVLKAPLIELSLQNTSIMPQECLALASDHRVSQLLKLDLSCNPIGFRGLCNLV